MTLEKPKTEIKYTATAGVLVFRGDEVLLVRHTETAKQLTGRWGSPAGRQEANETRKQTAVRELEEETGLIVGEDDLIEIPENVFRGPLMLKAGIEYFDFMAYACTKFSGEIRPSTDGKTVPEWVMINNLPENILPDIPIAIQNALAFLKH